MSYNHTKASHNPGNILSCHRIYIPFPLRTIYTYDILYQYQLKEENEKNNKNIFLPKCSNKSRKTFTEACCRLVSIGCN